MDSEDKKAAPKNRPYDRHKAIAMTRAMDMLSDEFIENFSQTGRDGGPESPIKTSVVREALAKRDRREAEEQAKVAEKADFRGFASLLASAGSQNKTSAFSRLLGNDDPDETPTAKALPPQNPYGPQTTADGSVITIKETSGKKRGLYTSCMQRPSEAQMQEAAAKFASQAADEEKAQKTAKEAAVLAYDKAALASLTASVTTKQEKQSIEHVAANRSKMTCGSTCPITFAFSRIGSLIGKSLAWIKTKLER